MNKFTATIEDTIAAISTPVGKGGIAVIRVSGKKAHNYVKKIFKPSRKTKLERRKLYFGEITNPQTKEKIDEALCVFMESPHTYTGENTAEIHSHGGYIVPNKILELIISLGARPADPGEFTKRAFLNGKLDLAQAEAVSDIINAQTEISLKQAENQLEGNLSKKINKLKENLLDILAEIEARVDFPEEDIEPAIKKSMLNFSMQTLNELNSLKNSYSKGKIFREGIYTAIIGKPNVGKSTLLNKLVNKNRAIVSPIAGTTRDFIEETINIMGIPLNVVDTAGIRKNTDEIETVGVEIANKKAIESEFLLIVFDQSQKLDDDDFEILNKTKKKKYLVVINKSDLEKKLDKNVIYRTIPKNLIVETSAKNSECIETLKKSIYKAIIGTKENLESSEVVLTNLRQKKAIEDSATYLNSFIKMLKKNESPEFLSVDIKSAMNSLGKITGEVTTEDILGRIFSNFCVGK